MDVLEYEPVRVAMLSIVPTTSSVSNGSDGGGHNISDIDGSGGRGGCAATLPTRCLELAHNYCYGGGVGAHVLQDRHTYPG